jgi:hypothetical protein
VAFGHFTGEGAVVFEMCFEGPSAGGVESDRSTMRVRCFGVARPTQVIWVAWIYWDGGFADGTTGRLGSRGLGCHCFNWLRGQTVGG